MTERFIECVEKVLDHEGGYVNDPTDRGGETKFGISKRAYPHVDIRNLTRRGAMEIYYRDYWLKNHCDELPEGVDYVHFDAAVNNGPGNATKFLQRAAGVAVDGVIGPVTMAAAQNVSAERYLLHRLNFFCQIVRRDNSQAKFIGGWANRTMDLLNSL